MYKFMYCSYVKRKLYGCAYFTLFLNIQQVWDRRCLNAKGKPAGILMGHLEGITYIDSRGDGRYFISNGKDQTTKLWDIRKMLSNTTWYVYLITSDSLNQLIV